MLNLEDKEWKPFKVEELFSIYKCKCSKAGDLKKGNIPYIGATNRNNGLMSFVEKNEKLMTQGNCITFICDGQGSVGYSIYKYENFIGSTTLKIGRNHELNKYNGLFFTTSLDMNKSIYDYGYKRNDSRLKKETIIIPSINEKPDYKYMENYTKSIIDKKLEDYKKYAKKVLKDIEYKEIKPLENKEWNEFKIYDIFSYQRGKRQIEANRKKGNTPYYSASQTNNGLTDFISNPIFKIETDAIIYSTFGDAYYVEKGFSTSDEITILINNKLNKFNGLFIINSMNKNKSKYSFGRKAFSNKIGKDKIILPINENNEPDYEYMEQYMKNITYKKINQYLDYKNKEA